MKERNLLSFIGLTIAFIFSTSLLAQEKTKVTVLVKKENKVIMDTTYQYNDVAEAKHAVKMMEKSECDEHGDGENVKVIIIKKKGDGDCNHEGDEEVEVIVEKIIKKKPKEQ